MNKVWVLALMLCFAASLAVAQEDVPSLADAVTLKGDIIDNMCAGAHKDGLADFVKAHTKECALAPQCQASGYSIFTDGKLIKFDAESNPLIAEFLKSPDSKLQVKVIANKVGDELNIVSIENQK
jgi:hypothetical protein